MHSSRVAAETIENPERVFGIVDRMGPLVRWVKKMETDILNGKHVLSNKARKHTLSDLIDRYVSLHLCKYPRRLKDQTSHLNWWKKNYGNKTLVEITPSLLVDAKEILLKGVTSRMKNRSNPTVNRYFSSLSD